MNTAIQIMLSLAALLILGSAMGAIRFPNAIMRLHATAKAGGLAASLILACVALEHPSPLLIFKIIFIILMILFTTAQAAHIIARSSLAGSRYHPKENQGSPDDQQETKIISSQETQTL